MNVRCPNCGAVFPAADGGDVECPLCLHQFEADGHAVEGAAEPERHTAPVPSEPISFGGGGDDEFEAFGSVTAPLSFSGALGGGKALSSRATGRLGAAESPFGSGGGRRTAAKADNPFAASSDQRQDTDGDIDFSALLSAVDEEPAAPSDTFATPAAADTSAPSDDPMGATAGGGDDALFGGGDDGLFGGGPDLATGAGGMLADDDSLFGGAPASVADEDDALMQASYGGDIATPSAHDDDHFEPLAGPGSAVERGADGTTLAGGRAAARGKKGKAGKKEGRPLGLLFKRAFDGVMLLALVVLSAGLAGDVMGYDVAGIARSAIQQVFPEFGQRKAVKKVRVNPSLLKPAPMNDTAPGYLTEIRRLRGLIAANPAAAELEVQLAGRLLDLLERYPTLFASELQYDEQLRELRKRLGPRMPARDKLVVAIAERKLDDAEALIEPLLTTDDPHDAAAAIHARLLNGEDRAERDALAEPGLIADSAVDPLFHGRPEDKKLLETAGWMKALKARLDKPANPNKFQWLQGWLAFQLGDDEQAGALLGAVVESAPDHGDAARLLAATQIRSGDLRKGMIALADAARVVKEQELEHQQIEIWRLEAAMAAAQGKTDLQMKRLRKMVKRQPSDELTLIRLARLMQVNRYSEEARKLLTAGQKSGMKSVAFEVAMVEYWLFVNRLEDALEEIKKATDMYPESVDVLFLRGQVEEKKQHSATALDYYKQVIARQPKHQRAVLRLADLEASAGRYDDALVTLTSGRKMLGDKIPLLEKLVHVYEKLNRFDDARKLVGELLERQPRNRNYLLMAAQMDLRDGHTDKALGYLRTLRDIGALDQAAAIELAQALARKGKPKEAARSILPFAEADPNDIAINTLTGKYLLDSGEIAHAETLLTRAYDLAQKTGGDGETTFQFGRLAFKQGRVPDGISRLNKAIEIEPARHRYRYRFALLLFDGTDEENARKLAIRQLVTVLQMAPRFEGMDDPVDYIDDVHRILAREYIAEARYLKAVPHLRELKRLKPDDVDAQVDLGVALHLGGADGAIEVLEAAEKGRRGHPRASLYLGLAWLGRNRTTEALRWFEKAVRKPTPEVAQAYFHMGLIYKERRQFKAARRALGKYLDLAPDDSPYRRDAESLLRAR